MGPEPRKLNDDLGSNDMAAPIDDLHNSRDGRCPSTLPVRMPLSLRLAYHQAFNIDENLCRGLMLPQSFGGRAVAHSATVEYACSVPSRSCLRHARAPRSTGVRRLVASRSASRTIELMSWRLGSIQRAMVDFDTQPRLGHLSFERFMSTHWRQAPLYLRGGASSLVPQTFDAARFERLRATLSAEGETGERSRNESVVFIEAIDRAEPALRDSARNLAILFGLPAAWFDAVRTHTVSGIGSHFDHSDNFVLQQEGRKTWRLSPPDSLPEGARARRMLGDKSVGAAPIDPDSAIEFVLEPGDLLYLPLFWIHEGVSDGPSLSLSLVCPAVSLRTVFLRSLAAEMARRGLGWNPVPACPVHAGETQARRQAETLARASAHLLNRLSDDEACRNMANDQARYLRPPGTPTDGDL